MLVGFQTSSLLMVQLHTCSTLAYLWVRPGMILQLSYFGQQNLSLYTYRKVFLTWNHNNWLKTKQTKNPCQTETKYYYARYGCRQTEFSVWLACPRKSPPPFPPPPPLFFSPYVCSHKSSSVENIYNYEWYDPPWQKVDTDIFWDPSYWSILP